jgi:prepilin-type N-terminal cleavage/methylation domain-containing protein
MSKRGVTIPEVLVALVILTLGLLGLGATGLYVTGMVGGGERAAAVVTFAARRLELLRAAACLPTPPSDGTEQLTRGSAVVASTSWVVTAGGDGLVRIRLVSTYTLAARRVRTDTVETAVVCG